MSFSLLLLRTAVATEGESTTAVRSTASLSSLQQQLQSDRPQHAKVKSEHLETLCFFEGNNSRSLLNTADTFKSRAACCYSTVSQCFFSKVSSRKDSQHVSKVYICGEEHCSTSKYFRSTRRRLNDRLLLYFCKISRGSEIAPATNVNWNGLCHHHLLL